MGRKSKTKSKRGSKPKNDKQKEPTGPKIDLEILKDVTLKDFFRFWNGDVYVGEFTITAEGGLLRHGKGTYFCADGHVFGGQWQEDVLVDAERISYPDGCRYRGPLEDGRYSGVGTYNLPQLGTLECSFVQGRPHGLVTLNDLDGFTWQGRTTGTSGSLTLLPRNHFFDSEDAICKAMVQKSSSHSQSKSKTSKPSLSAKNNEENLSNVADVNVEIE